MEFPPSTMPVPNTLTVVEFHNIGTVGLEVTGFDAGLKVGVHVIGRDVVCAAVGFIVGDTSLTVGVDDVGRDDVGTAVVRVIAGVGKEVGFMFCIGLDVVGDALGVRGADCFDVVANVVVDVPMAPAPTASEAGAYEGAVLGSSYGGVTGTVK